MRIEVYIDDQESPIEVLTPPEKFRLDTQKLVDGPHTIRFEAVDGEMASTRSIEFTVRNGPGIAVHGLEEGETVSGQIGVLTNAYGSHLGDEFEPQRIETPARIPTWTWVLCLVMLAWGAGYLSLELNNRIDDVLPEMVQQTKPATAAVSAIRAEKPSSGSTTGPEGSKVANVPNEVGGWQALGKQVYGINCSSCHQAAGTGLPGVFPPLVNNAAVLDSDPSDHINTILHGLSGKEIDGVAYAAPMPPFGGALSDDEVAAVVNHERTQWGNDGQLVSAGDVSALR